MKKFITDLLKDMIEQSWTLLGMAIAWLVLEGSARELTGYLILVTISVWIITFRLRNPKDKGKE
jgi:hypothetical protein